MSNKYSEHVIGTDEHADILDYATGVSFTTDDNVTVSDAINLDDVVETLTSSDTTDTEWDFLNSNTYQYSDVSGLYLTSCIRNGQTIPVFTADNKPLVFERGELSLFNQIILKSGADLRPGDMLVFKTLYKSKPVRVKLFYPGDPDVYHWRNGKKPDMYVWDNAIKKPNFGMGNCHGIYDVSEADSYFTGGGGGSLLSHVTENCLKYVDNEQSSAFGSMICGGFLVLSAEESENAGFEFFYNDTRLGYLASHPNFVTAVNYQSGFSSSITVDLIREKMYVDEDGVLSVNLLPVWKKLCHEDGMPAFGNILYRCNCTKDMRSDETSLGNLVYGYTADSDLSDYVNLFGVGNGGCGCVCALRTLTGTAMPADYPMVFKPFVCSQQPIRRGSTIDAGGIPEVKIEVNPEYPPPVGFTPEGWDLQEALTCLKKNAEFNFSVWRNPNISDESVKTIGVPIGICKNFAKDEVILCDVANSWPLGQYESTSSFVIGVNPVEEIKSGLTRCSVGAQATGLTSYENYYGYFENPMLNGVKQESFGLTVDANAFSSCNKLVNVDIRVPVESIGENAFTFPRELKKNMLFASNESDDIERWIPELLTGNGIWDRLTPVYKWVKWSDDKPAYETGTWDIWDSSHLFENLEDGPRYCGESCGLESCGFVDGFWYPSIVYEYNRIAYPDTHDHFSNCRISLVWNKAFFNLLAVLEVKNMPHKTVYHAGETFDVTGTRLGFRITDKTRAALDRYFDDRPCLPPTNDDFNGHTTETVGDPSLYNHIEDILYYCPFKLTSVEFLRQYFAQTYRDYKGGDAKSYGMNYRAVDPTNRVIYPNLFTFAPNRPLTVTDTKVTFTFKNRTVDCPITVLP